MGTVLPVPTLATLVTHAYLWNYYLPHSASTAASSAVASTHALNHRLYAKEHMMVVLMTPLLSIYLLHKVWPSSLPVTDLPLVILLQLSAGDCRDFVPSVAHTITEKAFDEHGTGDLGKSRKIKETEQSLSPTGPCNHKLDNAQISPFVSPRTDKRTDSCGSNCHTRLPA